MSGLHTEMVMVVTVVIGKEKTQQEDHHTLHIHGLGKTLTILGLDQDLNTHLFHILQQISTVREV
jgi:hypothetical protein